MFGGKTKTKISKYGKKKTRGGVGEEGIETVKNLFNIAYYKHKHIIQKLEEAKAELEEKERIVKKEKKEHTKKSTLNRYLKELQEAEKKVEEAEEAENIAEKEEQTLYNEYTSIVEANKPYIPEDTEDKDAEEGIYSFVDNEEVYCFSDLEGNMPKEIQDLMFDKNFNYIMLNQHRRAIVFTGDLIDRGQYSIRNLLVMLNLKKFNKKNVILACGNRDLNKIRMYHECCIKSIEERILDKGNENRTQDTQDIINIIDMLKSLETIEFKNSMETIAKNINIKGIVVDFTKENKEKVKALNDGTVDEVFELSYSNDISRIPKMYSNTLGSPNQIMFFKEEYIGLFNLNESIFDDDITLLYKFIAMMNMVMGKIWYNLPDVLRPYNGLYIKYLQNCHIIASFTIGNKLCFASHSGVPYYEDKDEGYTPHFYIPSKIGEENKELRADNNIDNIRELNKHFNKFIQNPEGIDYKSNDYKKYITMTAGCEKTVKPYSSNASPIVSSVNLSLIQDKSKKSLEILKRDGVDKIYNIFGHQPSGFLPYINRVASDYDDARYAAISYHIDLDISKAENAGGISNKKSFVYLKITSDDDRLYGKTISSVKYNTALKTLPINKDDTIHLKKISDKESIIIKYSEVGIKLDEYCENRINAIYDGIPIVIFTVDGIKHYGINARYSLVEYEKELSGLQLTKSTSSRPHSANKSSLVGGKKKIYAKSVKRFMNGKRQMVIYLGKRGGEYLKVKGEYISLAKYIKTVNKKK